MNKIRVFRVWALDKTIKPRTVKAKYMHDAVVTFAGCPVVWCYGGKPHVYIGDDGKEYHAYEMEV